MRPSYLSVLAEGYGAGVHVEHTCDVVALREAGQGERLLTVVVQVAAVGPVQPHVARRAVAVVRHRPLRDPDTRSFVATILLHDQKLGREVYRDLTQPDTLIEGCLVLTVFVIMLFLGNFVCLLLTCYACSGLLLIVVRLCLREFVCLLLSHYT